MTDQADSSDLGGGGGPSAEPAGGRPLGKEAVVAALVEAATALLVEEGPGVSVRRIAARAGVNHGLVHTYFGSKQALLSAAADEINRRSAAELDPSGFPPPDLATRRGRELATATARMSLDNGALLSTTHPIISSWRQALAAERPDLDTETIEEMVITASTLALGWAVFSEHLCDSVGVSRERRPELDKRIAALVAQFGGIPDRPVGRDQTPS
ncbi:MAG: TetR/AcrR family transcriptional regulator [Acidimicrobiales bacterium]